MMPIVSTISLLYVDSMSEKLNRAAREAIEAALPAARVEVSAGGGGHFEIQVTWASFENLSRVKQQQTVYAAIAHLMKGDGAPVLEEAFVRVKLG